MRAKPHIDEDGPAVTHINGHAVSTMTATTHAPRPQELPLDIAATSASQADPIARDVRQVDLQAAQRAAEAFLRALGLDLGNEELGETPGRMTRAYAELFDARPPQLTTFPNDEGYDELVLARAVPFGTVCEHHLLPFSGVAHVAYLPGERLLGLSKLARVVEFLAAPEHTCMTLRGVRARGTKTITTALAGPLRADPQRRAEFLAQTAAPS